MSCKLELELCGYVKDNCTKALEVCDFDCSDGEVGWLNVLLLVLIGLGIYYFFWIYRPRKKKEKEEEKRRLRELREDRQGYDRDRGPLVATAVPVGSLNQPTVF